MSKSLTIVQMLEHAGMLERSSTHLDIEECRREPERGGKSGRSKKADTGMLRFAVKNRASLIIDADSLTLGSPSTKK